MKKKYTTDQLWNKKDLPVMTKEELERIKSMPDSEVDFSDSPKITEKMAAKGKVRPPRCKKSMAVTASN